MSHTERQPTRYHLTKRPSRRDIALTSTRPDRQNVRAIARAIVNDPGLATELDMPVEFHHHGVLRRCGSFAEIN